jgi:hypothetical protein
VSLGLLEDHDLFKQSAFPNTSDLANLAKSCFCWLSSVKD